MNLLLRLALLACPAEFRNEYAEEMLRDLGARNAGLFASCCDIVRTGVALRLESVLRDATFALRSLAKVPLYTFVTIATIAIAISVNVAVASVVEGVLLKPLPYPNASRMVYIEQALNNKEFSYLNERDLEERSHTLEAIGIAANDRATVTGIAVPVTLHGLIVNAGYFPVLGAKPQLGRLFNTADLGERRVILSDHAWRTWFNANPAIVGKTIDLEAKELRVIGIAPAAFRDISVFGLTQADFWIPVDPRSDLGRSRGWSNFTAWGLLRPGVTVQAANADVTRAVSSLARQYPNHFGSYVRSLVVSASSVIVGPVTPLLWLLDAAVFVLLIIACANVANLSLVRAAGREREFVVRNALGATRSRLAWQLCTESAILVTVAGVAGVILAQQELRAFNVFGSAILPRWEDVQIDGAMLAYTAALLVIVAVVIGLLPAFLNRRDLCTGLKDAGRSGDKAAGGRVRSTLVVAEIALALAVAISAGLIVRSYVALTKVDPGFDSRNGYVLRVPGLPAARYPTDAAQAIAVDRMQRNIGAIPGVTDVVAAAVVPFSGEFNVGTRIPSIPNFDDNIDGNAIAPGFFHALRIQLLRGRDFNDRDRAKSQPVAIVSAAFARRFFGGIDNAMGRRIMPGLSDTDVAAPSRIIVGVVTNTRNSLSSPPDEELYVPLTQFEDANLLFVRTNGRRTGLDAAVARALSQVDPLFAPPTLQYYPDIVSNDAERSRAAAALFGLLAIVAVILALAGVYSVTAFSAAQRTREMGIRKAVGATDKDVVWVVVAATLRQSLVGIAIGLALAASAAGMLSTLLFQTSALDPATFAAVCVLLVACSIAGALVPAVKATSVAPSTALHYE